MIVTDRALAALPVLTEFRSHLAGLDVAVFDGVSGNPTCAQVRVPRQQSIGVESQSGIGSTFRFTIPVRPGASAAAHAALERAAQTS